MKYHSLFFSNLRKDVTFFSSAAGEIGALRVNVLNSPISPNFILLNSLHSIASCPSGTTVWILFPMTASEAS